MKLIQLNLVSLLGDIISAPHEHASHTLKYDEWKHSATKLVEQAYVNSDTPDIMVEDGTYFNFPYVDMGNINTKHLFGIDELIILGFYIRNRSLYRSVLDLGANVGLHTLTLLSLGYKVLAYEADPQTAEMLRQHLNINNFDIETVKNSAAASYAGEVQFTRVCGNLTGSHISGAKKSPYGKLEMFNVKVDNVCELFNQFDLVKMDIEGQEADVFCGVPRSSWESTDVIMEINGLDNAHKIYEQAKRLGLNLFIQKRGWRIAKSIDDLPLSYKDGSVFVSYKKVMPW
ncbi:FkbM family methyltransferase [Catenovulum sediminis]|uniref:FkbM family methyltransferase n=1 Tax=Catenovulum sediminis TaxID=1740262 RepID=A0ABV1RH06_9ALTE